MAHTTNPFYVTTPIYYVTANPHLGSLYSTLIADVLARWHKLQGKPVFFLTGTDEHGQKVAQAAQAVGLEPKKFVDQFIPAYQETWKAYHIAYNRFIRTTDHAHIKGAQDLLKILIKKGDIYKANYQGWYCTPCETFLTDKDIENNRGAAPLCPSCARPTEYVSEQTYFFKLSAYQEKLLTFYKEHPECVVPKERLNEVIKFVESGLKDLSISRTTISWGVPFPDDSEHVVYVWAEALANYLTGIGYGDPSAQGTFEAYWPNAMHVLGKDIIRFHALMWPALLMAAGLPVPQRLLVHGWIKMNKEKMSKSRGNVVDPMELHAVYGPEAVRFYLMRHIPVNQDGDFTIDQLEQTIESDLANDLGNLLNRMLILAEKNNVQTLAAHTTWSAASVDLRDQSMNAIEEFKQHMHDYMFHLALARLWKFINAINGYFHAQEPWKLAKTNTALFLEVLSATAHALRVVGYLLWPIMPEKMEALLSSLGCSIDFKSDVLSYLEADVWNHEFHYKKIDPLFTKPEPREVMEQTEKTPMIDNSIAIEDFAKVDLRVGKIHACEEVAGSDKLLKLTVDFGPLGERQILSGVKKHFAPADLIGKHGVFVVNLKPRKMMGMESHGMMLFASDDEGGMSRVTIEKTVKPGAFVK